MFNYTIYQNDCVQQLNSLAANQYDVIFIDPPYNTGNTKSRAVTYDQNMDFAKKNWVNFHADWDTIDNYYAWCMEWLTLSRNILAPKGTIYVCASFHCSPDIGMALRNLDYYVNTKIAWCLPNAFPNLSMTSQVKANQDIWMARLGKKHTSWYDKEAAKRYNDGKNLRDYWLLNNDTQAGKRWKHPSKKPQALVYRALDIATPKDRPLRILDYFAGSGTTGLAAAQLSATYGIDVTCDLVERDTGYCAMIEERINEYRREENISCSVSRILSRSDE